MKKFLQILPVLFLFVALGKVSAQASQDCQIKYSLFKGDVQAKKYEESKANLEYLMSNCPDLSVNIYKYGAKAAEKTNDSDLVKKVYEARLANYPSKGAAKAHSDYASYLAKNKLASDEEVFAILEKAYNISPKDMGVKNIYRYFEGVNNKYKDTDVQKVFDTYDDVMESVGEKLDDYNKKIPPLAEQETAGTISAKDAKRLKAYRINSKALGTVEGGLDAKIAPLVTCERLIPIYEKDYEANSTNGVAAMRAKAFELEPDPNVKAKFKLNEAYGVGGSKGRALAYEALKYNPNMGKAYLYIAHLYARSANNCGTSVFEKKMVYVAALNKARKAQQVDPGCGAGRYISSYSKNSPTKKEIFTEGKTSGSSHKVGCWIGETVRIP